MAQHCTSKGLSLPKAVKLLARHSDVPLADIGPGHKLSDALSMLKFAVNVLYDTDTYSSLIELIHKYEDHCQLIPGTVGAYLFGCLHETNYCSPVCAGNIPPPRQPGQSAASVCSLQIWYLQDGRLRNAWDTGSTEAVIYTDLSISALTQEQIEALSHAGVRRVSILTLDKPHQLLDIFDVSAPSQAAATLTPSLAGLSPALAGLSPALAGLSPALAGLVPGMDSLSPSTGGSTINTPPLVPPTIPGGSTNPVGPVGPVIPGGGSGGGGGGGTGATGGIPPVTPPCTNCGGGGSSGGGGGGWAWLWILIILFFLLLIILGGVFFIRNNPGAPGVE